MAARDYTANGDIARDFGGVGNVPAGENDFVLFCELGEAIVEALDPLSGFAGEGEGDHTEEGTRAHGGAIAERAGEGFVADVARVFVPGEVDAFMHHVGGEDEIVDCVFLAKDGTVVTDARNDAVTVRQPKAGDAEVDFVDDLRFGQANIVGLCCALVWYFVWPPFRPGGRTGMQIGRAHV